MNRSQVKRRNTIADDIAATRPTSHSPKTASLRAAPPAASTFDSLGRAQAGVPARQLAQIDMAQIDMAHIDMAHIDTWVFDLDNTLYPADCDLWPKIDQRITTFIIHHSGLDGMSSRALQKYYYKQYGTTLRGLMDDHGVSAEEFLAFVHDIDRSSLLPNPALAAAIAALPGRKLILTNGSRDHALRTAEALGLAAIFEDIFDIVDAEFVPKPERVTYQRFFDRHDVDPKTSAMFEDIERNLIIPHERGMATTLVVPKPGQKDHREPFEIATSPSLPHVDYMISDLEEFLRDIAELFSGATAKNPPTDN